MLSLPPVLTWACTWRGRNTLHFLSLSGLAAFALRSPLARLFIVAFANVCVVLRQVIDWTGIDGNGVGYHGICKLFSSICLALAKMTSSSDGSGSSVNVLG